MRSVTTLKPIPKQSSAEHLANKVIEAYEALDSSDFSLIEKLYAEDIYFEDPSHGIQGKSGLLAYFKNMINSSESCRFKFHRTLTSDTEIVLTWTMLVRNRKLNGGDTIRVEGSSYLKTRNGQIYYHRDYFDMGSMVYEHLPIIGWIIKKVRLSLDK